MMAIVIYLQSGGGIHEFSDSQFGKYYSNNILFSRNPYACKLFYIWNHIIIIGSCLIRFICLIDLAKYILLMYPFLYIIALLPLTRYQINFELECPKFILHIEPFCIWTRPTKYQRDGKIRWRVTIPEIWNSCPYLSFLIWMLSLNSCNYYGGNFNWIFVHSEFLYIHFLFFIAFIILWELFKLLRCNINVWRSE